MPSDYTRMNIRLKVRKKFILEFLLNNNAVKTVLDEGITTTKSHFVSIFFFLQSTLVKLGLQFSG